ncbi:unnamed protein product [Enterobius vermicularis]|uniref:L-Fucosyltransferase n=1 Tax=Enterobius vermicularis TaxID=51028 RepID=A0A3P6H2Z8_ENTVE|nr:unnamed protein product [Enterobius vermicularis]
MSVCITDVVILLTRDLAKQEHAVATVHYLRKVLISSKLYIAATAKKTCRLVLHEFSSDIFYLTNSSTEVDMATLTLCNHTIASVGTFSWWIGYMTGGETVYYKGWPRKSSSLASKFVPADYFPSSWIGMLDSSSAQDGVAVHLNLL